MKIWWFFKIWSLVFCWIHMMNWLGFFSVSLKDKKKRINYSFSNLKYLASTQDTLTLAHPCLESHQDVEHNSLQKENSQPKDAQWHEVHLFICRTDDYDQYTNYTCSFMCFCGTLLVLLYENAIKRTTFHLNTLIGWSFPTATWK